MSSALRFVMAMLTALALAPACAQEADHPEHTDSTSAHVCLDQKERRVESETGKVIRLAAAIHTAKSRMPGTVVRARLCPGNDGLVYVLTVLARDGKVARLTVDAVRGTLVGGL
jgi:uncharacterized membrane protein YkoI